MEEAAGDNRRAMERRRAEETGAVTLKIRPGHAATVVDISASGALVETEHRLLPGRSVDVQVEHDDRRETIRGRVLRCAVAHVSSSRVCYRGAIAFDRHLPWFVDDGYGLPGSEARSGHPGRVRTAPELA